MKIRAESPSLHFIRATVVTEIAPIVGTEQQAKDLIGYIDETGKQDGIWETNIFGKTVEQLVNDGIRTKISMIGGRKPGKAAGYDAKDRQRFDGRHGVYHYLGVLASVRSLRYKQPDAFWKRPAVCISCLVVAYRFAVGIIAGGTDKLRADFFAVLIGRKVSVGA